jgi:hypothetical protein
VRARSEDNIQGSETMPHRILMPIAHKTPASREGSGIDRYDVTAQKPETRSR